MKKKYEQPTQMVIRLEKTDVELIRNHAASRNEPIVSLMRRGVMNQIRKEKANDSDGQIHKPTIGDNVLVGSGL